MTSIWNKLNAGGAIIQNLENCDVRSQGMCCYFPSFCDPIAKCISTPVSNGLPTQTHSQPSSLLDLPSTFPRCSCPEGYQGDGRVKGTGCTNINECEMGIAKCTQGCVDLIPGFRCECIPGFRLENDGRTCRDVDECVQNTHDCSHICRNTRGGYECDCPSGYYLDRDGRTCLDIDECYEANLEGRAICPYHELCINTMGGYECGCPPGLAPASLPGLAIPTCEDIDECFNNADACPNGHLDGKVTQLCENVYGGHVCKCLPGLRPTYKRPSFQPRRLQHLDDQYDQFIDQIKTQFDSIPRSQLLAAEPYDVDLVESEHSFDGNASESPSIADESDEAIHIEIPEPSLNKPEAVTRIAPVHPLSKYDKMIEAGAFEFGKRGTSEDIYHNETVKRQLTSQELLPKAEAARMNELSQELLQESPAHAKTLSLDQLKRRHRWTATQRLSLECVDINECEQDQGKVYCGSQADCVNTFRSFECRCHNESLDFDPDTRSCVKSHQISKNRLCPPSYCNSPCMLTVNGYYCGCPRGYVAKKPETWEGVTKGNVESVSEKEFQHRVSDQVQCVDIDECALDAHVCGLGYQCKNTRGGYQCVCGEGKIENEVALDQDYDFLLAVSNQFQEAMHAFDNNNDIIRVMNRNGPRNTVTALASIHRSGLDPVSLDLDRWLIDQIDWSRSEFLELPPNYEQRLANLLHSDNLVKDFEKVTAAALKDSSVRVCAKVDPCHMAECPPAKPCCQSGEGTNYQCIAANKGGGLFNRNGKPYCPGTSVPTRTLNH